ncbi:MAG: IS1634 family transposase [Trueperaceae bacterium]|nr:IS1634 family transposase [Trueperaceae bacterium]
MKRIKRGSKVYQYVQLVTGERVAGRVMQRVVATLGRLEDLKASGELDRLAGAFARLDPPPVGTRREVGPLLLVHAVLARLGIGQIVDRLAPVRGSALLSHGEVIEALVANRLCAPAPLYDVSGWASSAALHELLGVPAALLNDDRLGRALEALAPIAELVRGEVALRAAQRYAVDVGRLHVDLTKIRVAGAYLDSTLVAKGWGPERRVARQVQALQAVSGDGVPLYVRPYAGGAADVSALGESFERLRELFPAAGVMIADSALGNVKNLCDAQRAGVKFIVPLRAGSDFLSLYRQHVTPEQMRPLRYVPARQANKRASERDRYRGCLIDWRVPDVVNGATHAFRIAFIHSSEEQRSVAGGRERALATAEAALSRVRNGLGGRYYKTAADVRKRVAQIVPNALEPLLRVTIGGSESAPTITWQRDADAIARAAANDGIYALATNLPGRNLRAIHVLRAYKAQEIVERRNHDAKSTLRVRPIFLHNDDRISALISIVGLALLIYGLIEANLKRAIHPNTHLPGLLPEHRTAKPTGANILRAFEHLAATYTHHGLQLDPLTTTQRTILAHLDIPLPWPEQTNQAPTKRGKRG